MEASVVNSLKENSAPSSVTDFCPIALLRFLSKTLEKIAYSQTAGYLNKNKILDPLQTGKITVLKPRPLS
jgi:hypothetical protein